MALTDDWLTAPEAATLLNVAPETVRNWTKAGKLPHIVLPSGRPRYQRTAIEAILSPTSEAAS